jgi:hypothetical protein
MTNKFTDKKFTVTITEVVAYEMVVTAHDADAAEDHARVVFQQSGHTRANFLGVTERTYSVEELCPNA